MLPSFAPGEEIPQGLGLLGDAPPTNFTQWPKDLEGSVINCDHFGPWLLAPSCWKYSVEQWAIAANQARSGTYGVIPPDTNVLGSPTAPGIAYSNTPVYSGDPADMTQYNRDVQAAVNAQMQQTQANIQREIIEESTPPSDSPLRSLADVPWYVWAALGVGVFALVRR